MAHPIPKSAKLPANRHESRRRRKAPARPLRVLADNFGARAREALAPGCGITSRPGDWATYAKASVTGAGLQRGDFVALQGEPILYGIAVPTAEMDTTKGHQFVEFMLSDARRRIPRGARQDALNQAVAVGAAANRRRVP